MKGASRKPSNLSASVHQRLNMYALAASAAGVGVLGLAQPADAKIVYTPAHVRIGEMHILDLNHDRKTDFLLYHQPYHSTTKGKSYSDSGLWIVGVEGNGIVGKQSRPHTWATPLPAGARIDANDPFYGGDMAFVRESSHGKETTTGLWLNGGKGVKNRYLGLRLDRRTMDGLA